MKALTHSDWNLLRRGPASRPTDSKRSGLTLEEELALGEVMDSARAALLVAFSLAKPSRSALRAALTDGSRAIRTRQGEDLETARAEMLALVEACEVAGQNTEALEDRALDIVSRAVLQEELQESLVEEAQAEPAGTSQQARAAATALEYGAEVFRLARTRLVNENVPLARMLAAQLAGRGVSLDDLFQEACAGLLRAVDRYDYRRGLRFNTYAVWWIRSTLRLTVLERGRLVHVPLRQLQALNRLRRAEARWRNLHEGEPTAEDIAEEAGIEVSDVQGLLTLPRGTTSLDADDDEGPSGGLHDRLAGLDERGPDEDAESSRLQARVRASLDTLPSRDALVVRMRFGIDCRPHTLAEVGEFLGVTRERARQLEARALGRLRDQVAA